MLAAVAAANEKFQALSNTSKGSRPANPLSPFAPTGWQYALGPYLHATMVANGVAVCEEALLVKLIRDIEERR
jgi:hypothetical protein